METDHHLDESGTEPWSGRVPRMGSADGTGLICLLAIYLRRPHCPIRSWNARESWSASIVLARSSTTIGPRTRCCGAFRVSAAP